MHSKKMGKEAGTNHSMGKVTLHGEELVLSVVFSIGEFYFSPLHVFQLDLICPVPVYISDDPRVFEVNQGVVDKESTSR